MHVHLREPGHEYKETVATGTRAAAAGGFTAVCCMANTQPVNDNRAVTDYIRGKAESEGVVRVYPIGAVTRGLEGKALAELAELAEAGCVAFSDDGKCVMNAELYRRAMEYTLPFGAPVISHAEDHTLSRAGCMHEGVVSTELGLPGIPAAAEDVMVARDIVLAELTGAHVHIAHLSTAGAVGLVRDAKARGVRVTAEVTPHHLLLTEDAVRSWDANMKMAPPLRSKRDTEALIEALADGTIDCVATDHAPHAVSEKEGEFDQAANGVVGLETAVTLLLDRLAWAGGLSGATGETSGEVIFNTAMTGYQEILTDPSYRGQIVTMTYPMIGNYGINEEDVESHRPWANGLIVKEASACPSSWRGRVSLDDYLTAHDLVGLQAIDTRALTRHLRDAGAQDGIVSSVDLDVARLREKALALPGLVGRDLVAEVTAAAPFTWKTGAWDLAKGYRPAPSARFNVVAFDAGIQFNILRHVRPAGREVTVVPASTPAEAVLEYRPDGVFLSNGPGDPEGVPYLIASVRALIGRVRTFGICLGHQIIGLAAGGQTYKLPFGHHGANHPVKDLATGRVEITAQNHGFAVDPASLAGRGR